MKFCALAVLLLLLVVVVGGIGSEVRGSVLPEGVFVSLTTTGAGALLHAAKSNKKEMITSPIVERRAQLEKADCILTNSPFRIITSDYSSRGKAMKSKDES